MLKVAVRKNIWIRKAHIELVPHTTRAGRDDALEYSAVPLVLVESVEDEVSEVQTRLRTSGRIRPFNPSTQRVGRTGIILLILHAVSKERGEIPRCRMPKPHHDRIFGWIYQLIHFCGVESVEVADVGR